MAEVRELTGVRLPASAGETNKTPYVIPLPAPCKAEAIRIEVTRCSHASSFFTEFYQPYYFRLSEIEAITVDGRNAALAANGAKARVSTTFRSFYNSPEVVRRTYPELYEMGVKWNRVGQWGDWTCWTAVEQEKGKYYMDPETDRAITESVRNGVQILYTLDYGNPLYEATPCLGNPGPVWHHGHPFHGGRRADQAGEHCRIRELCEVRRPALQGAGEILRDLERGEQLGVVWKPARPGGFRHAIARDGQGPERD